MRGEVVGINSQIYSRSGGFQGISFAIPIDEAVRVSDQLRSSGRVTRGRIGVGIDQVSKEVAESIGLGKPEGALVRSVEPDSPAAKAGIEPGDIIVRFDGKAIEKSVDLPRLVGNTKPGARSTVTVFRRGSTKDLTLTVGEVEAERVAQRTEPKDSKPPATSLVKSLGLSLSELTNDLKAELKLSGGVRIDGAEGAAARAGLREGDVILAVANTEVKGLKDFEAVVAKADKARPINVLFRRGEWAQYAVIRPAAR
jgi:serine protease Do